MGQLDAIATRLIPEVVRLFPQEVRRNKSAHGKKKSSKKKANSSFQAEVLERLTWGLEGERTAALEAKVAMSLSLTDSTFLEDDDGGGGGGGGAGSVKIAGWPWYRRWFPRATKHPLFYFIMLGLYAAVFFSFAQHGFLQSGKLGGLFGTFLAIPPQYSVAIPDNLASRPSFAACLQQKFDANNNDSGTVASAEDDCANAEALLDIPIQMAVLPVLYGVMHCVLLSLSLLPLGMCRGFARGLSATFPSLPHKWCARTDDPKFPTHFQDFFCFWLVNSRTLKGVHRQPLGSSVAFATLFMLTCARPMTHRLPLGTACLSTRSSTSTARGAGCQSAALL